MRIASAHAGLLPSTDRFLADWFLDMYELGTVGQLSEDLDMDMDNNAVGIGLSRGPLCETNCPQECFTALKNNQLRTDGYFEGEQIGRWSTWWKLTRRNFTMGLGR
jgi:hypothetical protein